MKHNTPLQRIAIYKRLLNRYAKGYWAGFCLCLRYIQSGTSDTNIYFADLRDLPELMLQKPKRNYRYPDETEDSGYWWSKTLRGAKKRVHALHEAIRLAEKMKYKRK